MNPRPSTTAWILSMLLALQLPALAAQIVAHRGASADAPENTLAAFKLGYEQGADAVELDIQLTQDGRLVVFHDFDTARVTGHAGRVEDQTLAELRALQAGQWGRWKNAGFSEKIPTLEEVLEIVPAGRRLFVEIKCHTGAVATARCRDLLVPELERTLNLHPDKAKQVVLITFSIEAARRAKERLPQIPVCWLFEWAIKPGSSESPRVEHVIEKARAAKLDGLDLHYKARIDAAFVKHVRDAGLQLHVWTVDDPQAARKLADAGVDSLTTNKPRWLRQQLAQQK